MTSVSHLIDHTLLAPDARTADIDRLCREAVEIGAASVCVNPVHVARCAESLREEDVKVCAVIAFPFGASLSGTKACEPRAAVRDGAQEVDMVLNLGAAKDGEWDVVGEDVRAVVEAGIRLDAAIPRRHTLKELYFATIDRSIEEKSS